MGRLNELLNASELRMADCWVRSVPLDGIGPRALTGSFGLRIFKNHISFVTQLGTRQRGQPSSGRAWSSPEWFGKFRLNLVLRQANIVDHMRRCLR